MLRVKNVETAEILTNQLPQAKILTTTFVSGSGDTNDPTDFTDFTSSSEDRLSSTEVPLIQPADLVQLPKGQAFGLLEGGQLVKLRLPMPAEELGDTNWPDSLSAVFEGMQAQYSKYVELEADGKWRGFEMPVYEVPTDFAGNYDNGLTKQGMARVGE